MSDGQLDLFSDRGGPGEAPVQHAAHGPPILATDLDDEVLIAAIPGAARAGARPLADEAGRRRLGAAIPALEELCRRFTGFGRTCPIPEQKAALEALTVIGGAKAAQAVARMIERAVVQGPTLRDAVSAAARLHATLRGDISLGLLKVQ